MDAALNNLTSEQKQQIMIKAQQEANTSIMQSMMEEMVESCFDRCAGTSVRTFCSKRLHSHEQVHGLHLVFLTYCTLNVVVFCFTSNLSNREINLTLENRLVLHSVKIDILKLDNWYKML
jgi:hypothetical protein